MLNFELFIFLKSFPDNNVPSMNYLHTSFVTKDDNESKVSKDMVVNDYYNWNALTERDKIFTAGVLNDH